MSSVNIVVETKAPSSIRAKQVASIFDVPLTHSSSVAWKGELPIGDMPWQIGLILGPSGCGKTTILTDQFGTPLKHSWDGQCVLDDFSKDTKLEEITDALQSVGFNTIPAWLRPYDVLSNGEKFRIDMARSILENDMVVVDEFTSVVDRQVAQIASHAVQKYVRKHPEKRFVAASCHYDIVDWLQPDWILEPATMKFTRRELRRRPQVTVTIERCDYEVWNTFKKHHYMSADLNKAARCYVLKVNGQPAAFGGVLYRPHPKVGNCYGLSRMVTLPDYQGLGLAFVLMDYLGSAYSAQGMKFHTYPAHPPFIRAFAKLPNWKCLQKPGLKNVNVTTGNAGLKGAYGGRPNATFQYVGPKGDLKESLEVIGKL